MKETDTATPEPESQVDILGDRPDKNRLFIVGIGASAGGIQALKEFFESVPADSDMAFVVILHLSPDHDSILAKMLQAVTGLPVAQVTEKVKVEKNHVYVVSPNQHLEMIDGFIITSQNMLIEDRRAPVDIFFRTLAESHGSQAVAVILSGTGANGSMGIKRIKEKGGTCFVQNPREAEFNEMPRNSIATGLIDDILSVRDIPAKIIAYKNGLGKIKIPEEPAERPEEQQQALREIFTQVRLSTGHDFTNYKRPTLLRRIERRVNVRSLATLSEYAGFLHEHPEETQALLKDLLISVTNFFRDAKVFTYLEQDIIPRILTNKNEENEIRVWVAGCATGEEAYSLAMLFAEHLPGINAPKIQIFATDIDESAITIAREGCYTINDAADVSPERLHRFFTKDGDEYRVRREIREMVLFARHNAIKDPPFSHLDMITCRNLLIYLNQFGQERLMETFHFALETSGYLMLGTSETVDGSADLYSTVSRDYHIYKSRQMPARIYPIPESVRQFQFEKTHASEVIRNKENRSQERISYGQLHGQLLEKYAPPSVVVNEEYEIVHLSESAGKYLQVAGGEPTQNLLKLVKPELRLELRSALYQGLQRRANVELKNIKVNVSNVIETINIHVRPVLEENEAASGFILVLFEPVEDGGDEPVVLSRDEPVARQLDEELTRLKVQLRTSIEQHEFQSEELKASNEELQAMNEELRSATEELETSKEELQSINEELITVNQELKVKVDEISLAGNNLQNLINSTDIGTIFLDRSFRVNMFTPSARSIFNLISNDYGRPLSDITHKLQNVDLHKDAETVIDTLTTLEREVETTEGKSFLMRVSPYRTAEDRISGVVVTFVDITRRKQAEEASHKSEERFRAFVTASTDVIYSMSADWTKMQNLRSDGFLVNTERTNETWLKHYIPEEAQPEVFAAIKKAIETKSVFELEHKVITIDGTIGWVFSRAVPLLNEQNEIREWFGAASDITERKQATEMLQESEERLQLAIKGAAIVIWEVNPLTGETKYAGDTKELLGFEIAKNANENFSTTHPDDKDFVSKALEEAMSGKVMLDVEHRVINPGTGELVWLRAQGRLIKRTQNEPAVFIGITQNITNRKFAEEALRASEARLQKAMQIETVGVVFFDDDGNFKDANDTFLKMNGYSRKQFEQQGLDAEDVTPADWMRRTKDALKEMKETGVETPYEKEFKRSDGSRWWGLTAGANIHTNENVEYIIDVSNRKQAEQDLAKSEERLRITMESATDYSIISTNTNGLIEGWNSGAELAFGYTLDEVKGKRLDFLFIPEDVDAGIPEQEMKAALEEGRAIDERWHQRKDGTRFFMSGIMRPIKDGSLTGYVKVARDMTEQKQAEERLKIAEERHRIALQSAEMAAWDWNIAKDTVTWNEQHYLLLGLQPDNEERSAAYFVEFVYEEDVEKITDALKNAVEKTGIYHSEFRIKRADNGEVRWMNGFGRVVNKENGRAVRMVGVMFDINDRKKLEQQKEDFISVASHELKTPVTSIKAYAEILHDMFLEVEDVSNAALIKKLDVQVDRLIELIRALLDTSRINQGELLLKPEKFDLNKLVTERVEDIQRTTSIHHIICSGKETFINADKERIGQVLTNLLSNAIKYSPKGGDVTIKWKSTKDKIQISVKDEGIGISEEGQKKVFERFFRDNDAQAQNFPGMGLGLYITANIIHRHDGEIRVNSTPGEGSTFYFTLPLP